MYDSYASITASATTSITAANTWQQVALATVAQSAGAGITTSTANELIIVTAGVYEIEWAVSFSAGTSSTKAAAVVLNGATSTPISGDDTKGLNQTTPKMKSTILVHLNAADVLTLWAQCSASSGNTVGTTQTFLNAYLISTP